MRILYITAGFSWIDDLLHKNAAKPNGLPSQFKIMEGLIKRGDVVDLVVADENHDEGNAALESPFFKQFNSVTLVKRGTTAIEKALYIPKIKHIASSMMQGEVYDFVYLHGGAASSVASNARKAGIVCGQRAYGSPVSSWLNEKGTLWTYLRHYPEMAILKEPKDFLLATDDGSRVDSAVSLLFESEPPYDFYQWVNGVDLPDDEDVEHWRRPLSERYIFHGARIYDYKGQHHSIEILRGLRDRGFDDLKLVFAGCVSNQSYYKHLLEIVEEYELGDQVTFLGSIPQEKMQLWHHFAEATIFYSPLNRGNSFLEAFASGALLVVPDDDQTVTCYIDDEITGFCVKNESDAVCKILSILETPDLSEKMRSEARKKAHEKLDSWDRRVARELKLIDFYVSRKSKTIHRQEK